MEGKWTNTESGNSAQTGMSTWAVVRAISKFRRSNQYHLHRKRRGSQWVSSNPDSFIARYTTQRRGSSNPTEDITIELATTDEEVSDGLGPVIDPGDDCCYSLTVNPDGNFLFFWLFLVAVAVYFNAWFGVAMCAWNLYEILKYLWILNLLFDFVYVADMVVQIRTAYLEHGLLVHDSRRLAKHYIKSKYFLLDLISTVPLDSWKYAIKTNIDFTPFLRLPRLLKLYRARQFAFKVEAASPVPNVCRTINFIHFLLLVNHLAAVAYFVLFPEVTSKGGDDPTRQLPNSTRNGTLSGISEYLRVYYWSTITLTTIGDVDKPQTDLQFVVQIIGFLLGVFGFATVVGQVGIVINQRNARRMEFEQQVDNAKKYMRENEVPKEVQNSILGWYQYTWARGKSIRKQDVDSFEMMPTKLRTELAIHVNLKTLKKVSFFRECEPEFLHDLVLRMQLVVATPGELVCRQGEIAREMFIISDGVLEVLGNDDTVIRTLQSGDVFGEIGLLMMGNGSNRRTADVRSIGYSDLFIVTKEDAVTLLDDYPKAKSALQDRANLYMTTDELRQQSTHLSGRKPKTKEMSDTKYRDRMRRSLIIRDPSNYNVLNLQERATFSYATSSFRRKWRERKAMTTDGTPGQTDKLNDAVARDVMESVEAVLVEKLTKISEEYKRVDRKAKSMEDELEKKTKELEELKAKFKRFSSPVGSETLEFKIGDSDCEDRKL